MKGIEYKYKQVNSFDSILYSWFGAMNTRVDIVLCNQPENDLKYIAESICKKIKSIEKIGNYFDPESELSIINKRACNNPIKISQELFSIIVQVKHYHKISLGYFDVTIHSRDYNKETISHIVLDEEKSTIYFNQESLNIDLSGFLKGYTLDTISRILEEYNITDALINIGNSSIIARGNQPYNKGWNIGFGNTSLKKNAYLMNQCLTTSGNNHLERKHIINPHTKQYFEGQKSISIISDTASDGEVLSTALFAAPAENHAEILKNFNAIIFH